MKKVVCLSLFSLMLSACSAPFPAIFNPPVANTPVGTSCLHTPGNFDFKIQCTRLVDFYVSFEDNGQKLDLRQYAPKKIKLLDAQGVVRFDSEQTGGKLDFRQEDDLTKVDYTAFSLPGAPVKEIGKIRLQGEISGYQAFDQTIEVSEGDSTSSDIPWLIIKLVKA